MFSSVKIVLINTTHPGNIGATARAMKNMGLNQLCLVCPKTFPAAEATARASGAEDILEGALVVDSLDKALADCHWILGLSARLRKISAPILDSREAAIKILNLIKENPGQKVALLFGQEQSGLLNEALDKCHFQIIIPANEAFPSLNLAQAVQVIAYELRMSAVQPTLEKSSSKEPEPELATAIEMEDFYHHLAETLIQIEFLNPKQPGHLMTYLRRLFNRSSVNKRELNILRGILTAFQKRV